MPNFIYIAAGLLIAALLVIGGEFLHIRALDSDLVTVRDENSRLTTTNESLSASAQRQDAAIKQIKLDADARAKTAQLAILKASKQAQSYKKGLEDLANYKRTGDKCVDTLALLKLYYTGAHP